MKNVIIHFNNGSELNFPLEEHQVEDFKSALDKNTNFYLAETDKTTYVVMSSIQYVEITK